MCPMLKSVGSGKLFEKTHKNTWHIKEVVLTDGLFLICAQDSNRYLRNRKRSALLFGRFYRK